MFAFNPLIFRELRHGTERGPTRLMVSIIVIVFRQFTSTQLYKFENSTNCTSSVTLRRCQKRFRAFPLVVCASFALKVLNGEKNIRNTNSVRIKSDVVNMAVPLCAYFTSHHFTTSPPILCCHLSTNVETFVIAPSLADTLASNLAFSCGTSRKRSVKLCLHT